MKQLLLILSLLSLTSCHIQDDQGFSFRLARDIPKGKGCVVFKTFNANYEQQNIHNLPPTFIWFDHNGDGSIPYTFSNKNKEGRYHLYCVEPGYYTLHAVMKNGYEITNSKAPSDDSKQSKWLASFHLKPKQMIYIGDFAVPLQKKEAFAFEPEDFIIEDNYDMAYNFIKTHSYLLKYFPLEKKIISLEPHP